MRSGIATLVVVLSLGGVLAPMAFAQDPYPLYGMPPGYPTDSLSTSTGLSWYFAYSPGAPGYDPRYTPGTLGYDYAGTCGPQYEGSYSYGYGLYRFGPSGWSPCVPASPEATSPGAVHPTPMPPQLTIPTPDVSPTLEPPSPTPAPQADAAVQACSTEPCTPPQPQYATMAWGTFGTFENWARKFREEHCCCPTDKDVADFWASQTYLQQTGQTPFSGGFCWQ